MDKDTPISTDTLPPEPPEDECQYYQDRPQKQAWAILGVVAFVVGVAVLWVYQTGDRKTILSKKDINPQAQAAAALGPPLGLPPAAAPAPAPGRCTAQSCSLGGHVLGGGGPGAGAPVPAGGPGGWATPYQLAGARAGAAAAPSAAVAAVCTRCGKRALPLCHRCNSIMLPLGGPLFYCPHCGAVGTPLCPYCGSPMTADGPGIPQFGQRAQAIRVDAIRFPQVLAGPVGGQFVCPRCFASGLPNWTPDGRPTCPRCGATMSTRGRAAIERFR